MPAAASPTTEPAGADLPVTSGHNPALDGLRVIAALAVLVTHIGGQTGVEFTGSPLSWVISRGDVGVPIFFVLSGLLLYRPWARAALRDDPAPAVGSYFWRRALRILPAYWVVVAVAMLTLNAQHARSVTAWAQYLLLVQNYDQHPWWTGTGASGLAQMWSLDVEVSFYIVLPVLAAALTWRARRRHPDAGKRARRLLTWIAIFGLSSYGFAVLDFYPRLELWLGETLLRLMTWFAAGMALAVVAEWAHSEPAADGRVARFCRTVAGSADACWLIALLAFAVACTPLAGPESLAVPTLWEVEIKTALYTIIATALVAPAAFQSTRPTWVTQALGNPVMSYLGKISYGVFLWQYVVIFAVFNLAHAKSPFQGGTYTWPVVIGAFVVVLALTLLAAFFSYHLIELPAHRLSLVRRRHSRRGRLSGAPYLAGPPELGQQHGDDHQAR